MPDTLEAAAAALRAGGVVIYPTETFYGLAARADSAPGVAKIARLKGRAPGKALPLIAADLAQAEEIVLHWPGVARRLAQRFWPGPLTLVLPAVPGLAPGVASMDEVGVRVPGHALAQKLAAAAGFPIAATSANLAGGPEVADPALLDPTLLAGADAVLLAGPTPGGLPSTVVRVTDAGLVLLRAGAVSFEQVSLVLSSRD